LLAFECAALTGFGAAAQPSASKLARHWFGFDYSICIWRNFSFNPSESLHRGVQP